MTRSIDSVVYTDAPNSISGSPIPFSPYANIIPDVCTCPRCPSCGKLTRETYKLQVTKQYFTTTKSIDGENTTYNTDEIEFI